MDLSDYRSSEREQARTDDLLGLMPASGTAALDVGARDGHFSHLMATRFERVVALDLELPAIAHAGVECVQGNASDLAFADGTFDFVLCAEVLEHIPAGQLPRVCAEIQRVTAPGGRILIGVPYRQDIRVGRTTCRTCGTHNPPWGHVNSFDEAAVHRLFTRCRAERVSFVGLRSECTNALSSALMDFAANPYGTYGQEERCVNCGTALTTPPDRNLLQRLTTKLAFWARMPTQALAQAHGNWIHLLYLRES